MKLSRKWLNEFVDLPLSTIDDRFFAEAMTVSGSKVEVTEDLGAEIENVVVGKILSMVRHENSDHMWVCQMDVGQESPVQIVTGAQNQKEGDLVPVALDGAKLPGGKEIKAGKLRGVESNGMCCSYQELGFTDHDWPHSVVNGLFVLNTDPDLMAREPRPGDDIRPLLGLDDHVVEFEITPNRPDCLCTLGLAREAAVTFNKELRQHVPAVAEKAGGNIRDIAGIIIEEPLLCPRYTARMVRNVKIAPSPLWMRERIRAAGMRPINNIVDITNYVMLELGQPMHAFDFACVEGGQIHVRLAREGESIETLDGTARALTPNMLCICDVNKPVCVAGVMGGANSEIVGDTAMVLFESANFNGASVRRTATALGMRTDASARYEKGLDPANTVKAVERACELVELLGAGEVVSGSIDVLPGELKQTEVMLVPEKINALLGTDIEEDFMRRVLLDLGFGLTGDRILVPSWRGDVEHYSDIAEEVARFYGYNNIPTAFSGGNTACGAYSPRQQCERAMGAACRALGMDEIITYSFISPGYYDKIRLPADSPLRDSLKILNPLGEDTSIMRTTTLPSMLEILTRNYNFRNRTARLYEIGKTYFARPDGLADEPKVLTLGAYGPDIDFYVLKGWVEELLSALRMDGEIVFEAEKANPSYHPGRCARVSIGGECAGVLGQVHPLVSANYGIDASLYAAELKFDVLFAKLASRAVYRPLPRFPSITRDLSIVCRAGIPAGELRETILSAGGGLLRSCDFAGVYTGAPILPGFKSVTFSLTLRSDEQTLTDASAEEAVKNILTALEQQHEAVIR